MSLLRKLGIIGEQKALGGFTGKLERLIISYKGNRKITWIQCDNGFANTPMQVPEFLIGKNICYAEHAQKELLWYKKTYIIDVRDKTLFYVAKQRELKKKFDKSASSY